ncbi:MAG: ABC transporter permease [Janthinobacterium lividum]
MSSAPHDAGSLKAQATAKFKTARAAGLTHSLGPWALPRLRWHFGAWLGLTILAALLIVAASAGWFYPGDPLDIVGRPSLWPGVDPHFALGTDMMGRNMAAGMAHGARISLAVGAAAALITVLVGTAIGAVAGYFGGVVDDLAMRITEMFQTMPSFLFTVVLVVVFGSSLPVITLAIGATSWPQVARLVRAEAMRVRETDFVRAATTMGVGHLRMLRTHIIPNSLAPVIVLTSILIGQAILVEASLSFLGLGDPAVVSWGTMVATGRPLLRTAWYMTALPGAAIFVSVMSFMLLGNWLNDRLNPRDSSH